MTEEQKRLIVEKAKYELSLRGVMPDDFLYHMEMVDQIRRLTHTQSDNQDGK